MNSQPASCAARATRSYSVTTRALIATVGRIPSRPNNSKKRHTPTRMPYSCQAQFGTSGSKTCPVGAGRTCRAIGREISQNSRLTIVHTATRAPPGSLSGGRSTIAEYGARSRGITAAAPGHAAGRRSSMRFVAPSLLSVKSAPLRPAPPECNPGAAPDPAPFPTAIQPCKVDSRQDRARSPICREYRTPFSSREAKPMRSRHLRGNIFVANLPPDFSDERLAEIFDSFGIVLSAFVARDPTSGKRLRHGFVDIATERAAQRAVSEMNGVAIDGYQIEVQVSERKPPPQKPAPPPQDAAEKGPAGPAERGFGPHPPRRQQRSFVVERRPLPRRSGGSRRHRPRQAGRRSDGPRAGLAGGRARSSRRLRHNAIWRPISTKFSGGRLNRSTARTAFRHRKANSNRRSRESRPFVLPEITASCSPK